MINHVVIILKNQGKPGSSLCTRANQFRPVFFPSDAAERFRAMHRSLSSSVQLSAVCCSFNFHFQDLKWRKRAAGFTTTRQKEATEDRKERVTPTSTRRQQRGEECKQVKAAGMLGSPFLVLPQRDVFLPDHQHSSGGWKLRLQSMALGLGG